jgi:hypothetical protein
MTIPHGFDWRRSGTLLANERAHRRLPCGCVPVDTSRRCLTARKLRVLLRNAESDLARHHATMALAAHLTGEGV